MGWRAWGGGSLSVLAAGVGVIAQTSPAEVTTNVAAWWQFAAGSEAPKVLLRPGIDGWMLAVAIALALVAVWLLLVPPGVARKEFSRLARAYKGLGKTPEQAFIFPAPRGTEPVWVSARNAIAHIAHRAKVDVIAAERQLRQAAADGAIRLRGRPSGSAVSTLIDPSYWREMEIDLKVVLSGGGGSRPMTGPEFRGQAINMSARSAVRYSAIEVDAIALDSKWPPIVSADWRLDEAIDYVAGLRFPDKEPNVNNFDEHRTRGRPPT